jgi:hypothetical protein
MRTRLVRRPGQHGTKDLVAQYGDRLVCVRYRYDAVHKKRYKTVELIVEAVEWSPPPDPTTLVALRIALHERDLQQAIRKVGWTWNRPKQAWELRYDQVVALGLTDRIVPSE